MTVDKFLALLGIGAQFSLLSAFPQVTGGHNRTYVGVDNLVDGTAFDRFVLNVENHTYPQGRSSQTKSDGDAFGTVGMGYRLQQK